MDNKTIDVSIIMPVYNHEKYLKKAIESVLSQKTEYNYELLIGEDCSTDDSRRIVIEYARKNKNRIKAFCRKKNLGATKNIYSLCMKARGRYIAILEGDDYWCDTYKLQKQLDFLDNNIKYIGVACNYIKVDENDIITENKCIDEKRLPCVFTWNDFLKESFLFQTATFLFRNIFLEESDYTILYKAHDIVGDMTILTILLNRSNVYIMQDVMSAYREIIKVGGANARSIAVSNQGLSIYKGIRQLYKLQPYLKKPYDFDVKMSYMKADYLIKLIKREDSFSYLQYMKICKIGNKMTNIMALKIIISQMIKKVIK